MSTVAVYARAWQFQFNGTITAANSVLVDSAAGDDVRGLGTMAFPFQTLNKAIVYANSNSKNYIICRGYFSETISNGYNKYLLSDQFGTFVWDGQNMYSISGSLYFGHSFFEKHGVIAVNAYASTATNTGMNILVNMATLALSFFLFTRTVCKGIVYGSISNYGSGYAQYGCYTSSIIVDFYNATRYSTGGYGVKCIYDNDKIYLDRAITTTNSFDTCLFRVNCTFWKKNASTGVDERVDSDSMTAAQKKAVVLDWIANGTCCPGYYKYTFNNCQWTDNRIFNCPDNDTSGTNWDFSLIYGTKEAQPACHMDGGKHIGPFAPAIKIEFKNTADLTTSAYEVEVKDTDNLNLINGQLTFGSNFTGATLYSKPMLVPLGTQFNGFNLSLFPDAAGNGVYVTGQTDSIDMSEANRLTVNSAGVALTSGVCYLVDVGSSSSIVYKGTAYAHHTVLMTDDTSLATSTGTGYLYPMPHPSIWQNVQFKICESAVVPANFKTDDVSFPWYASECFTKPADVRGTNETGLRCLRVGNVNSGVIDTGSDGAPLTSAHPEYYNATNQARAKFFVRANYVMLRITITRFFS
jgi:hypothetical protein